MSTNDTWINNGLAVTTYRGSIDAEKNVKNHGAKGDEITEDTSAFNQAISKAGIGGVIFVPKGTYIIDRVYLLEGQTLFGEGEKTVIRLKSQTITDVDGFGGPINIFGTAETPITGVRVRDLCVDGNKANLSVAGSTDVYDIEGINLRYAKRCYVENIRGVNTYSDAVDLDDCEDVFVTDCTFLDCGGHGVHMSNGTLNCVATNCVAYNCGHDRQRAGFDTHNGVQSCKYVSCRTENCYRGFHLKGDNNFLVGCEDKGSSQNNLRIEGVRNRVTGFRGTSPGAGANGLTLVGTDNDIDTSSFTSATEAAGIKILSGSNNNRIRGVQLNNNTIGIDIASNSNYVMGCNVFSNTTNLDNTGTGNRFHMNIGLTDA